MGQTGFLEVSPGNKSNSRLIALIVVIWALVLSTIVLIFSKDEIINGAIAAGTLFITMAGPAMTFVFMQKRTEENLKPPQ